LTHSLKTPTFTINSIARKTKSRLKILHMCLDVWFLCLYSHVCRCRTKHTTMPYFCWKSDMHA
jgi:hypothetical protein